MKAKILSLILFTSTTFTLAQYATPNTGVEWTLDDIAAASPETVTVSGNEYTLHEDLLVEVNDALSINQSTVLKIDADVLFEVKGRFVSDAQDVLIRAVDNEHPFAGFWFYDGSEILFRNTTIEHCQGLKVVTANFEMYDSEVSYSSAETVASGVISFSKGSPIVKNSTFKWNANAAISSAGNGSVSALIEGNYFEGNHMDNGNSPQINMGPSGEADTLRIINNTVIGSRNFTKVGGIAAISLMGVPSKILIRGNTITDNRYGITSMGNTTGVIDGNIIEDNNTEGDPMMGGSGINLFSTNLIQVKNNQIRRNLWGVTLQGTAQANFGSDDEEDFNPGGNVFSENGNAGEIYALFNNTSNAIKALHNCWIEGQESTEEDVEGVISHKVDDTTLGEVFFDPFECGVVMSVEDLNQSTFQLYPNPAKNSFFVESLEKGNISIYDLSGKKVLSKNNLSGKNQINLFLPKGIYLVQFETKTATTTKKLVVE